MAQLHPYLNFNGNCREAMTFYRECIGGELTLQTIAGTPFEARCPPGMQHQIMHSTLVSDGLVIMASDMNGPEGFVQGTNVSLSLNCSSEEEINTLFSKLSSGGKVMDPLKDQFWGAIFGAVRDKFGIAWMFNFDKNRNPQ